MSRSVPALVLAAAAGAAATYLLVASRSTELVAVPRADESVGVQAPVRNVSASAVAERAAVYAAAAQADAGELARLARTAAARPPSALRTFTLGVLLARYAELDAARAIALGRELRAPVEVLATLYADWASADPASARAALAEVDDPVAATTIGLAMFTALGGDERALRQITAELPNGAERGFLVSAIAAVAESDPAAALDQALELAEPGLDGLALQRIATEWARADVAAALAAGDAIADANLRATFQSAVLREWAQYDLDAVFAYYLDLDTASQEELAALGALREVARIDPYRALELSERLAGALRIGVEQVALQSIAQHDPEAALKYVTRLPPGQQQQLRQSLARAYGKQDGQAALAWARGTGARENLFGVLGGIAITNPTLAFEVLATLPAADRSAAARSLVNGAVSDRGTNLAVLADGLLALESPLDGQLALQNAVGRVLGSWASRSLSAALEWSLANAERMPPNAFSSLAAGVARNDVATAEQYLAQIPTRARFAWLQGMAEAYAQTDPSVAATWIERFRGEAAYPAAVAQIAQSLAQLDPPAAASVLDRVEEASTVDAQVLMMTARSIGTAWARTNAPAAADWARRIAPDDSRRTALGAVAEVWASSDYAAARSWALRLPEGRTRDAALNALLTRGGGTGGIDTTLLTAFSDDTARQSGVLGAVYRIAARSPADARLVAERHLTTPARRQQAEQAIEQIERQQSGNVMFFSQD